MQRGTLPQLQSCVIVLLKLLLATVTANNNNQNSGNGNDSGNGQPNRSRQLNDGDAADLQRWLFADDPPELNLEDTDIMRHREITSKA